MKKILLTATILASLPVAAFAGEYGTKTYEHHSSTTTTTNENFLGMTGPYVTGFGGWNKTEKDAGLGQDDGFVAGVAAGGKTRWARAELEASYRNNDLDNAAGGSVSSTALMANAYWDIETNTRFTPYIGAGIGAAYVDYDTTGGDDSVEFAYQGMAGANYAVTPAWKVGAEYRYFATTQVDNVDYNNHAVLGTVTYAY